MLKVKSYNTSRILAEMEDISTWPTKKDGRAFKPGYFYSLGQITQPLNTHSRADLMLACGRFLSTQGTIK